MKRSHQTRFAPAVLGSLLLIACGVPPRPQPTVPAADTPAYADLAGQLASLNREAEADLKKGQGDKAATAVQNGLPIQAKLLEVPRPTLEAMQAISDLDDIYARMLLAGHREGWARIMYQKNVARWKYWKPETDDSARRLKQAETGIAECDRRLK
jgi:hypothetical protein